MSCPDKAEASPVSLVQPPFLPPALPSLALCSVALYSSQSTSDRDKHHGCNPEMLLL